MFVSTSFWKMKREELKRKRSLLLADHQSTPKDPLFETRLKILDDEISYCSKCIEDKAHLAK
jgi:hypothetical protein